MRFAEAAALHAASRRLVVTQELVQSPELERAAATVKGFARACPEDESERAASFARRCKAMLRDLVLTPLPPLHPVFALAAAAAELEGAARLVAEAHPGELAERARRCSEAFGLLAGVDANPLGDAAAAILSLGGDGALAVLKTRHFGIAGDWIRSAAGAGAVTADELTALQPVEFLLLIGPPSWWPDHVLASPRAESICFLSYGFSLGRPPTPAALPASQGWTPPAIRGGEQPSPRQAGDELQDDWLTPRIEWHDLFRRLPRSQLPHDDVAEARVAVLAGGLATYLEAGDDSQITAVRLDGTHPSTEQAACSEVRAGDYLVLRVSGSSTDLIAELADAHLGARAARLRSLQSEWKTAVRREASIVGVAALERDLRADGMRTPSIRSRISRGAIRPHRFEDFEILLRRVGLGGRAREMWEAMSELIAAHLSAGLSLRESLEAALLRSDLQLLRRSGHLAITLDDASSGALGVFRVEGVSERTVTVPEPRLRALVSLEADSWPG